MTSVIDRAADQGSGRRLRVKERRLYTEEFPDEEIENTRLFSVEEKLSCDRFNIKIMRQVNGEELTVRFFQENGFSCPLLVKGIQGLGMKVPDKSFGVEEIRQCVGNRRILDVMDVTTQTDSEMTMKEWCKYWEETPRTRFLNVISLEFSHTKLEHLVESPAVVRQLDWVDHVWPKHLKERQTESTNAIEDMMYPKVQKYVLMSVVGCYTDFHIDFGGTSVWYHIISGKKVFWLIPPSEKNIQLFEQWVLSGKQADIFFGDLVDQCSRVYLEAGDTFFIPSGYIHSVFTPEDSIVFGGNFLHSYAMEKQLRVAQVEDTTRVPVKFRFPFYTEMLWYLLQRYVHCLTGKTHLSCREDGSPIPESESEPLSPFNKQVVSSQPPASSSSSSLSATSSSGLRAKAQPVVHLTASEVTGLKAVIMWLSRLPNQKRAVPELIVNPEALLNEGKILVDDHANDDPIQAASGRLPLIWKTKPRNAPPLTLTAQLRQMKPGLFQSLHHKQHNSQSSSSSSSLSPSSSSWNPLSGNGVGRKVISDSKSTPLTLSNFAVQPSTILNEMPSSFNDLIAASSAAAAVTAVTMPSSSSSSSSSGAAVGPQSAAITSFVSSSLMPSTPVTANFSTQTLPLSSSAKAAFVSQQQILDNQLPDQSPTPISVIPDQVVDPIPSCTSTPVPVLNGKEPAATAVAGQQTTPTNKGTAPDVSGSGKSSCSGNDSSRRRRTRCKKCDSCVRADCGDCHFCKDMKKFGGPGRMKQSCITRQCMTPVLPHTACCTICGRDGWEKLPATGVAGLDENQSSLMECSSCWEIVHPVCLLEKNPSLALDSGRRDDLPNSWECPKCVAAAATKSAASSALKIKSAITGGKVVAGTTASGLKKTEAPDQPAGTESVESAESAAARQATSSDEDELPRSDDEVSIAGSKSAASFAQTILQQHHNHHHRGNGSEKHDSSLRPHPLTPKSSFVKSCARFPLPNELLSQQGEDHAQLFPLSDPQPASKRKKSAESLKDRFFRSLKTLKKNSDPASPSSSLPASVRTLGSTKKAVPVKVPKAVQLPRPSQNTANGNTNSCSSPPVVAAEQAHKAIVDPAFDAETDEETEEEEDNEAIESMDTNDSDVSLPRLMAASEAERRMDPEIGVHGKPLIKPKYVVRPAPIPEDCVESEDDEDEDADEECSEDEEEMSKRKVMRRHLRNFRRPLASNLALERDVVFPTLRYLTRNEVLVCSQVCKPWNAWTTDPSLWNTLSASGKKITPAVLISIVRRQPLHLDLSWSKVSKRQIAWLMPRLPQLQSLSLSGCSAAAASALVSCNTPLLKSLDLSWIDAFDDELMRDLLSSPADQRPGLVETKTRLRLLQEISVAGSEITDASLRLMSAHLSTLSRIDMSNCTRITDTGIASVIGSSKTPKLTSLLLYGCDHLTDQCFESFKKCSHLARLDLRNSPRISIAAFTKFFQMQSAKQHRLTQAQNKLMCVKR